MTDLKTPFAPRWDGSPPHMPEQEALLWRAWRRATNYPGLRVWYDIGLGEGLPAPPGTAPEMVEMWRRVNQKRADALIEHDDHIELIEVRVGPQASALGRLLMYQFLLLADYKWDKDLQLTLVTNQLDRELAAVAHSQGIHYVVV